MNQFSILLPSKEEHFCGIEDKPENLIEKGWRIRKGLRMNTRYPTTVHFRMGKMFPGLLVPDLIRNLVGYYLISEKLKQIFEREIEDEIEYLHFKLLNHKGQPIPGSFYIANIIGTIDCVDLSKTKGRESKIVPGTFRRIKKLSLNVSSIPQKTKIFRIKQMPEIFIVRNDLKKVLEDEKIIGVQFIPDGEEYPIP